MPEPSRAVRRSRDDRCPGVLRLAEAADGFLARVRLPGGLVTAAQLRVLARLAGELGDGRVELTSRGNVQLRGLAAGAAGPLTGALTEAGLLPSLDHDRVRNVLASPLAGLDRGADLTDLVGALDAALCARPRLAGLPGRFLFAVDDGRGDVAGLGADVNATVTPDGAEVNGIAVTVRPGGARAAAGRSDATPGANASQHAATDARGRAWPAPPTTAANAQAASAGAPTLDVAPAVRAAGSGELPAGLRDAVAEVMLAFAEAFLDLRAEHGGGAWRVAEVPGGAERLRGSVAARFGLAAAPGAAATREAGGAPIAGGWPAAPGPARADRPVGLIAPEGGRFPGAMTPGFAAASAADPAVASAVLLAPLGRLTAAQVTWVADQLGADAARVTPWRGVVLPRLADAAGTLREAARLGFGTDEDSPWLRVTACAGRPGCASALADVQADAAGLAARWPGRLVHVSGCARHCGRPAATEIDVTASSEGYQVAGI